MDLYAVAQRAELELVALGYTQGVAEATVAHSLKWAIGIAEKVRPANREATTIDLFRASLATSRRYADGMTDFLQFG